MLTRAVFTARNKVWARLVFTRVCDSVHRGWGGIPACIAVGIHPSMPCSRSLGWGWYPTMPCRFPGPHPRGKLRGLAWGVCRPTPRGVCRPTPRGVCIPACTEADPPPRRLLLRAVRILLECNLFMTYKQ